MQKDGRIRGIYYNHYIILSWNGIYYKNIAVLQ